MKRFSYLAVAFFFLAPAAFAQAWGSDHINVGVFGNFVRISDNDLDLAGVGARLSLQVAPRFQLEAESSYNFEQTYFSGFSDHNGTVSVSNTQFRAWDGLFGPKLYIKKGPVRLFVTAKGGFMDFNLSASSPANLNPVPSTFQGLNRGNVFGTFYPGGGAEIFWGPIGLRAEVGDEMFFHNGAHNNLRVSFGPTIRF